LIETKLKQDNEASFHNTSVIRRSITLLRRPIRRYALTSFVSTSIDSTLFLTPSPDAASTDSSRFPDLGSSNSLSASICLSRSCGK